jgi:3-oxoacyl-[acyl-carrier-protein] synthase II
LTSRFVFFSNIIYKESFPGFFCQEQNLMDNLNKVVITGCGIITALGDSLDEFWNNLCNGNIGYGQLDHLDTSQYNTNVGGVIDNFSPEQHIPKFELKEQFLGKTSQFAISACYKALQDANLTKEELSGGLCGVAIGTTDGETDSLEKMNFLLANNKFDISDSSVPLMSHYRIPYTIAREFQLSGPISVFASACASSNHAIAYAWEKIALGLSDIMIAGGADTFSRKTFTGFNRVGATANICRPFDEDRSGMVPSEGSAIVILESLNHALKRGASIYAEVLGCGVSCDAYSTTRPHESGIALAMNNALTAAKIKPSKIDLICAHGTGTKVNDFVESNAINKIYGWPPVTANKSALGHTMGTASILNVITIILAMKHNTIPKTSNVNKLDPSCPVDCVLENRSCVIEYGQSNGFAIGGNNGIVILKNGNLINGL